MVQPPRKPAKRRSGDPRLQQALQRLDGPLTSDRVAAVAARHAIKRLGLEDNTRTWATLKAVIEEAVALRVH